MHGSMTKAQTHRDLETKRRNNNLLKKKAHGLVRMFGLDPAHTPCLHPDGTHRERRKANQPERQRRREFKTVMAIMMY
jgi:hypothetical protein